MKNYTGIGSRNTPQDMQTIMTRVAIALANDNWVLRSGGAEGADTAFDLGAHYKRIYLPWDGFNGKQVDNVSYIVPPYNEQMVFEYHTAPHRLTSGGMRLMSRNSYQVLGDNLDNQSSFLVCWTSDGKMSGGTGQAMRIAQDFCVPIYNLYHKSQLTALCRDFNIMLA